MATDRRYETQGSMEAANAVLGKVVSMHETVFGYDKTVKLAVYTMGLVNGCFPRDAVRRGKFAAGLEEAASVLGWNRVCNRLAGGPFGIPAELDNFINVKWTGGWEDPQIRMCSRLQSLSMLLYYPLEHLLWADRSIPSLFKMPPSKADAVSRVSCMAWSFWIIVEMYALSRKYAELTRIERALNSSKTMRPHYQRVIDRKRYDMLFQLVRMLAYLPNAVHWTLPGDSTYLGTGLSSRPMVVFFGFVEAFTGWIAFYQGRGTSRPDALPKIAL